VAVPIALKAFLRVEFPLETQEIDELGIAGLDLPALGPAVVGEVIPAAEFDRPVDDPPEVAGGLRLAGVSVKNVQVADDADRRFPSPVQKALGVLSMNRMVP
jgi:hypothetical protein